MLVGTCLYSLALTQQVDPVAAVLSLGMLVVFATTCIAWQLPKLPVRWESAVHSYEG